MESDRRIDLALLQRKLVSSTAEAARWHRQHALASALKGTFMISIDRVFFLATMLILVTNDRSFSADQHDRVLGGSTVQGQVNDGPDEQVRRLKIQKYVAIVTDDKLIDSDRSKMIEAILMLGFLKAESSVPLLCEKLEFHRYKDGISRAIGVPVRFDDYPAVRALIDIGEPAVPAIMDAIASKDRSKLFMDNVDYTLCMIFSDGSKAKKAVLKFVDEKTEQAKRLKKYADSIPD